MQSALHTPPAIVRVLVLIVALGVDAPVSAQLGPQGLPIATEPAYMSASGMVAGW